MNQPKSIEIGRIISVAGSKVSGIMATHGDPKQAENILRSAQVGAVVTMTSPHSLVFGIIGSLSSQNPSYPPSAQESRIIEIDLMGEAFKNNAAGQLRFQRGVSVYPALGSPILTTSSEALGQIYAQPGAPAIEVGVLRQDRSQASCLKVDELIGQHFAILGNSGTGKSCAITVLLRAILEDYPRGHVLLLDPHDEYVKAFGGQAEVITPENLSLPYWLLNFGETVEALCGREPKVRDIEAPILKEAILAAKLEHLKGTGQMAPFTVDTPIPYSLVKLREHLRTAMGRLSRPEKARPYLMLISKIEGLQKDARFGFMFSSARVNDSMSDILSRILRIPVEGRPITIFTLSGVPSQIVDVVVSLLCRLVFDFALWGGKGPSVPLLLVCEEAHRYAPRDPALGFAPTRRSIARIAKEGRKYGVSLGLVTQRPSEISEMILSQCNTLVIMRLSNERDQRFVTHVLPENAAGLLAALPALRSQEAIVVGEGVSMPMMICFEDLEPESRPRSATHRVSHGWHDGQPGKELVEDIVERWRRQER